MPAPLPDDLGDATESNLYADPATTNQRGNDNAVVPGAARPDTSHKRVDGVSARRFDERPASAATATRRSCDGRCCFGAGGVRHSPQTGHAVCPAKRVGPVDVLRTE